MDTMLLTEPGAEYETTRIYQTPILCRLQHGPCIRQTNNRRCPLSDLLASPIPKTFTRIWSSRIWAGLRRDAGFIEGQNVKVNIVGQTTEPTVTRRCGRLRSTSGHPDRRWRRHAFSDGGQIGNCYHSNCLRDSDRSG